MKQAKFTLDDDQLRFLSGFDSLGYADRSALVREAIDRLRKKIAEERLRESARLYAEDYEADEDLRRLTEGALHGWPD